MSQESFRMSEPKIILLLFLTALIFRVVICLVFSNEIIPGPDQMQEIALGRKLAGGDFYGVLDTYWAPFYPILIGIVSFLIDSPVVPAAFVSVLAGSLIVALTYIFVLQSYGRREALIAAVIAIFFPHLINSVVALGSENVFMVVMLALLIIVWHALLSNSILLCLAAGAFLGLAYLSRPEAIGYSLYLVVFLAAYDFWHGRKFPSNSVPRIAALLLGLSIFATPYILYLRAETGQWTVSGKAEINTIVGELETEMDSSARQTSTGPIKEFAKYFLHNLIEVQKTMPALFPLLLWLFVGLGLFASPWGKERFERETFLILFCAVTVAGYAAAVVQLRYFYVLLPILIGWMAHGIVNFTEWLQGTAKSQKGSTAGLLKPRPVAAFLITAVFLYVLPLNLYMRSTDSSWETSGYEERDAGLWIRQNGSSEPYVFSASRRPAFYAEARQLTPKTENVAEVLSDIEAQQVDYVVTSDRSLKRNPFLAGLDKILLSDPNFELVYENTPRPGYGVSIFRRR